MCSINLSNVRHFNNTCDTNVVNMSQKIKYLIVDTTAFINNAPLQEIAENIVTVQEVVDEIINKRQLRRLIVLPYDLTLKDVFPENIKVITDFSKKTGDYPSLSATDIKVMALTYQLEKEKIGTDHLKHQPTISQTHITTFQKLKEDETPPINVSGFYLPGKNNKETSEENADEDQVSSENEEEKKTDFAEIDKNLNEKFATLKCEILETGDDQNVEDVLAEVTDDSYDEEYSEEEDDDDNEGWITPDNLQKAKKQMDEDLVEDKPVVVACITTDFAMQNVLKQIGLQVSALDGRVIKQLRTFILRCHTCFKTTSLMDKQFCPKCGNKTLKKVAVSVDPEGKQVIHINGKRPLTARGKKFSLPTFKGGKHSNNPVIAEDQPMPEQRPTRQARMKNNPLDPDYTAGFSPFVMRDINSRSALLGIRPGTEVKHWMKKNPNEARRRRKK